MKKHDIPKQILERVEAELLSDEDLLWVGQPHPTRFLMSASNKTHPLLATIVGIEILLLILATFASLFLLAGILLFSLVMTAILGEIGQQLYSAKQTIYAITNKRALTIHGGEVETFGKNDLQSIIKKTKSKGRGDIIFRRDSQERMTASGFGLMLHRQEVKERGFLGIENPQQVELLLLDTFSENIDTRHLEDHDEGIINQDYNEDYQLAETQG